MKDFPQALAVEQANRPIIMANVLRGFSIIKKITPYENTKCDYDFDIEENGTLVTSTLESKEHFYESKNIATEIASHGVPTGIANPDSRARYYLNVRYLNSDYTRALYLLCTKETLQKFIAVNKWLKAYGTGDLDKGKYGPGKSYLARDGQTWRHGLSYVYDANLLRNFPGVQSFMVLEDGRIIK